MTLAAALLAGCGSDSVEGRLAERNIDVIDYRDFPDAPPPPPNWPGFSLCLLASPAQRAA